MQREILEAHPDTPLTVIAIWFNMVQTDSRKGLATDLLTDPRVVRLWDQESRVGKWYGENLTRRDNPGVEWDAWFLYGPEATWEQAARPLAWGRPVLATSEKLREGMKPMLATAPHSAKQARPAGGQP